MNTYRLIALTLVAVSAALVLPSAAVDIYCLAVHKLDNYYWYMLALPALVLSFLVVQVGTVVGFLNGWKIHAGKLGAWLIIAWAVSMGFLVCRFLYA